ncbi:PREDICTED: maspardin isoform X2 [Ipomoea nil]|uniref:maspardin isoform X2 n=1 Tax=Ipomoea nil TaxID=35883 RepID=UPI0009013F37|nr:PREDICTED: maspardin isoform X2 [Ipomoea nil]
MKGVFSAPGDYIYFKSQVPLHKIPGYRVISVDIARAWNHHEWVQAFEKFLDAIDVHHIHLYGTALGGFLAQLFAQHRPRRVRSLVLSNTFLETTSFAAAMPWAPVVAWTPSFLLKRYVLTGIRDVPQEPFIADSVDFVVSQVEALAKDDLASRLTLTADAASVGPLLLPDSSITLMDTNDYCATPQQLKDQVRERYPGARQAILKTGGDFPFLSRPDEVNLHLQLHLRRVGVEARPDLVRSVPRDGNGESSDGPKDERGDSDDGSKDDDANHSESPSHTDEPPFAPGGTDPPLTPQGTHSHTLANHSRISKSEQLSNAFSETELNMASRVLLHFIHRLLPLYLGAFCANSKHCLEFRNLV